MKRTFFIPFISALVGGGVVVAVIAAFGGLNSSQKTVTTVEAAPLAPSNASQKTTGLTPHDVYVRDAPGVAFVTSTIEQKSESSLNLFGGGESERQGQATGSGIVIDNNAQIILVDTPGIFLPKRRLDRAMVSTAWGGAHDADLVCVLLDAREGIDEEADAILTKLATVRHPKILVLNKIDLVPREKLLALAKAANDRLGFEKTFMVSALSGDGVDDLRHTLAEMVPPGPFHYPEDQMSDAPMRHLAAEITREKIFRQLHQELPYQSTVETDSWTERKDKSIRIEQTIFVERESQRKIMLGKGGATIKSIGADSRKEIAEIVGVPVHLFLFVKVRENWGDDPDRYREMGLEFPKE